MRRFARIMTLIAPMSLFLPAPASARAALVAAIPAAGSSVTRPARITLTFNEKLIGQSARIELFMTGMPKGMEHNSGMDHGKMDHNSMVDHAPAKIAATAQLGKDGQSMSLTPRVALVPGLYRVKWTAAGSDNAPVSGTYNFTIK